MIKINLGCGWRNFGRDWTHIDGGDYTHLDKTHRDLELSKFANNSIDLVYASHLIAYFDKVELKRLLKEWHKKIKRGGVLRLATPDFAAMSKLYTQGKINLVDIEGPLYGKMMMGEETIYHKITYDLNTLTDLLEEAGFKRPLAYNWRDTEHAQFDDHSQAYLNPKGDREKGTLISLNIQCTKP